MDWPAEGEVVIRYHESATPAGLRRYRDGVSVNYELCRDAQPTTIELLGKPDTERDEMMLWTVDLGHRFGSEKWPYTLHVGFDEKTGRADAVFTTD